MDYWYGIMRLLGCVLKPLPTGTKELIFIPNLLPFLYILPTSQVYFYVKFKKKPFLKRKIGLNLITIHNQV